MADTGASSLAEMSMKIKANVPNPRGDEKKYNRAVFVIWASADGRTGWYMVKPEETPEWVKHRDVLGRLVNGEMCMQAREGTNGSLWYRADVFLPQIERRRLEEALKANDLARAKKLLTLH
jgi:hypothetical protein